jgi:thioredoxin 1
MKRRFLPAAAAMLLCLGCQPAARPPASYLALTDADVPAVLAGPQPVMIDCFATWCGPCQEMAPVVEELAMEFQGRAVVRQLDVDQNPATSDKYQIHSIPAFLFFKNGQLVDQVLGAVPKQELASRLEALVDK